MEISQGIISGKTLRILQELEGDIIKNPNSPIFTNSKDIAEYIKGKYPKADIRVCDKPEGVRR